MVARGTLRGIINCQIGPATSVVGRHRPREKVNFRCTYTLLSLDGRLPSADRTKQPRKRKRSRDQRTHVTHSPKCIVPKIYSIILSLFAVDCVCLRFCAWGKTKKMRCRSFSQTRARICRQVFALFHCARFCANQESPLCLCARFFRCGEGTFEGCGSFLWNESVLIYFAATK